MDSVSLDFRFYKITLFWLFGVGKRGRILLLAKAKSSKSFFLDSAQCVESHKDEKGTDLHFLDSALQNRGWNRRICEVDFVSLDFGFCGFCDLRVRFCGIVESSVESQNLRDGF